MEIFVEMFRDLVFYRIKVSDGYILYAANIHVLTDDGLKYVMLVIPNTPSMSTVETVMLQHVRWVSLQTRTLTTVQYNIPSQEIDYRALDTRYAKEKITLSVVSRNASMTNYSCDRTFGDKVLTVSLLHDPKRKTIHQYPNIIDLRHALKTFQCIIKLS